jgi:hypothetical protein
MIQNGLTLILFLIANAFVGAEKNYPARAASYQRACAGETRFISNVSCVNEAVAKAQGVFLCVACVEAATVRVTCVRRAVGHAWKRPVISAGGYAAIGA